jgi:Bacterial virulence protein (VirJ)
MSLSRPCLPLGMDRCAAHDSRPGMTCTSRCVSRSRALVTFALISTLAVAACAEHRPVASAPAPHASVAVVRVQNRWLLLHLSRPAVEQGRPLLLYMTGDGGWRGKDLDTFTHVAGWGEPVAGFSAPDYLDRLSDGAESLPPPALARDIAEIASVSRLRLGLPPTSPLVLVGVSRGADLAVIAAASRPLRSSVAGVLAVGLTDEEEYVRRRPRRLFRRPGDQPGDRSDPPLEMVKPYQYLGRVIAPVALVQSTRDEYVPAARARDQFGPDTPMRRLTAVVARDHSFSDVRRTLYRTMYASFEWLLAAGSTRP